jgi:hypothetical protein
MPRPRAVRCAMCARVALLGGSVVLAAGCGDDPTGPREVVTPEGVRFTASVDRAEIARGDTAVLTIRLANLRDTAVTLPGFSDGCGLVWEAVAASGVGVSSGCAARGGPIRLAAGDSLAAHVLFTGREAREGGVVFEYPAGTYTLKGLLGARTANPYDPLPATRGAAVRVR